MIIQVLNFKKILRKKIFVFILKKKLKYKIFSNLT